MPDSEKILIKETRKKAKKCPLKGIYEGARVVRGLDWTGGDVDGGMRGRGTVTCLKVGHYLLKTLLVIVTFNL